MQPARPPRSSFRLASIAIGGVLADQLGIAAVYYLSGSLLIAAGLMLRTFQQLRNVRARYVVEDET